MSKYPIRSRNIIPMEIGLVSDVSQLIDTYANVQYNKVYQMVKELIEIIINFTLRPIAKIEVYREFIEEMTKMYIGTFGLSYRDFKNKIDMAEEIFKQAPRGAAYHAFQSMNREYVQPVTDFMVFLTNNILQDKIMTNRNNTHYDIYKLVTPFFERYLIQWAQEEGFGDLSQIQLEPILY